MMAFAIVLLGVMVTLMSLSVSQPASIEAERKINGDAAAVNFMAYRQAVIGYLNANPAATGRDVCSADATILPLRPICLWQPGYIAASHVAAGWTHTLWNSTLYTYTTRPVVPGMMSALRSRTQGSLTLGSAVRMAGVVNFVPAVPTPAGFVPSALTAPGIPDGAIVLVGK